MSSESTKPAPRKTIDITKNAKYTVQIGETLRKPGSAAAKEYTSVRYNNKPASVIGNGKKSILKHKAGGKPNEVSLEITPNDEGDDPILFEGAEEAAKPTECLLIYDPATGTFILEKITSTFVVNQADGSHPPLQLPPDTTNSGSDGEPDDAAALDPAKADPENPFDFRHFLDNTFEVPLATREDQARKAERNRANNELDLSGATSSGSDAEESSSKEREKDADGDLIFEDPDESSPRVATPVPRRPAPKPKAAAAKATPATTTKKNPASARSKNTPLTIPTTASKAPTPNAKRPRSPSPTPYNADSDADNSDDEDEEAEMSDSGELIIEDDGGLIIDEGDTPARPSQPRYRPPPPSAQIKTLGGHRLDDEGSSSGSDSEDELPQISNGVGLTPPVQAAPQEESSDEDDNDYRLPAPPQEDEDEISDADEDSDAPQQQAQQQKQKEEEGDVSDADEEDEFDLQAAFEAELADEAPGTGPSMGSRRSEDDESSSEEE